MYIKICEYCHKEFEARNKNQRFCNREHYANCCICDKEIKLNKQQLRNNKTLTNFVCSNKCNSQKSVNQKYIINNGKYISDKSKEKRNQTMIERYGGNGFASKELKTKYEKTSIERYGTLKNSLNLEKRYQTNLKKYGSISPFGNKNIQEKIKQTNLKKYGNINPFSNKDIQEKAHSTMIERYGNINPASNDKIKEKIKQTNLKKYGKEYGLQAERIKNKSKQTKLERYGDPNYTNWQKANKTKEEKYGTHTWNNKEQIIKTNIERYGISYTCQLPQVIENNKHMISNINKHFKKKLDTYNIKSKYEFRIQNMSYDLKIEDTNILIELNEFKNIDIQWFEPYMNKFINKKKVR